MGVRHLRAASRWGSRSSDPALQVACYAAWNDWAVEEFNASAPDRLCVLAFLPSHSPEAAAAELERCAALGHRGAIIDVFAIDLGDPAWDRLWAAAEDTGLPISFHLKGGTSPKLSYEIGKWKSAAFATVLPLQLDEPLATMVFSGALERHPGLKLVLAESGVGWLPYFLTRMDLEWRNLRDKIDYAPKHRAERAVPPAGLRHLRGGGAGAAVHPPARRGRVHVGVGLPAHRQHVPGVAAGGGGGARHAVRRRPPQDHGDELRPAVRVPA